MRSREARKPLWIALWVSLVACDSPRPTTVNHPKLDKATVGIARGPWREVMSADMAAQAERLKKLKPFLQIGTLAGAEGTVLGRPVSVAVTSRDEILVLDALSSDVRVFDRKGVFQRVLSSRGGGPLEIFNPVKMDIVSRGDAEDDEGSEETLLVTMRASLKLMTLDHPTPRLIATYRPPETPLPSGACAGSEGVYLRTALRTDSGLVARLDDKGRVLTRFGAGYAYGAVLTREELSVGDLTCVPGGGTLVTFTYLPTITRYDSTGSVVWSVDLPDFVGLPFVEDFSSTGAARLRTRYNGEGDLVQSVASVPPHGLLVQVARLAAASPERPNQQSIVRRRSFLIDVRDGSGSSIGDSLPILTLVRPSEAWAIEEHKLGHPIIVGYKH